MRRHSQEIASRRRVKQHKLNSHPSEKTLAQQRKKKNLHKGGPTYSNGGCLAVRPSSSRGLPPHPCSPLTPIPHLTDHAHEITTFPCLGFAELFLPPVLHRKGQHHFSVVNEVLRFCSVGLPHIPQFFADLSCFAFNLVRKSCVLSEALFASLMTSASSQ